MVTRRLHAEFACLAVLAVLLMAGRGGAATWEEISWRTTLYYRSTFQAPAAVDARLHVAAVDSYAVYVNGALIGSDTTWTRMGAYPVRLKSGANEIGVVVVNRGLGVGAGLVSAVIADSLLGRSTTNERQQSWYWSSVPQSGTAWTTATVATDKAWRTVQGGTVDLSRVAGLVDSSLAVVAGMPDAVDVGAVPGAVALAPIGGQNLAMGKPSNRIEVVDGDLNTSWDPPTNSLNFFASVDLQVRRHVHAVRVLTKGRNAGEWAGNSLRGYSVQVSDDQIRWTEVGVLHGIATPAWTEVRFTSSWTRYVRIVIVEVDPVTAPKVAELQVFGEGYADEGYLVSAPSDLGAPGQLKNFGEVRWDADVPERTELTLQLRTGNAPADFANPESGWSAPLTGGIAAFPAPEPARYLQYRVHLVSHDDRRTPVFQRLALAYDGSVAVSSARGRVTPNKVPMGVDTTFTYVLDLGFAAGDAGIGRVTIDVPSEAWLDQTSPIFSRLSEWSSSQRQLTLVFAVPVTGVSRLEVPFRTQTHASLHPFRAYVYSPGSDSPLNVAENTDTDPQTSQRYSWMATVNSARARTLSEVGAKPPVFTPNGDGVNDATVIEFVLSKVSVTRPVKLVIRDLAGRVVRDLEPGALPAGAYLSSGRAADATTNPGYWDGRDDSGSLVPPGLYLYHVEVDLDTDDEAESGIVAVAY